MELSPSKFNYLRTNSYPGYNSNTVYTDSYKFLNRGIKRSYSSFCSGIIDNDDDDDDNQRENFKKISTRMAPHISRELITPIELDRFRSEDLMEIVDNRTIFKPKQTRINDFFLNNNQKSAPKLSSESQTSFSKSLCIFCINFNSINLSRFESVEVYCQFCMRFSCKNCIKKCECCLLEFCKFCITTNYDSSYDRLFCLDCQSQYNNDKSKDYMFY